ncbi:hypothetical protein SAMN05660742_10917 [Propionispira arboris]|uniref:WD40-like Beta Propeller Repeat n=2 Tax=Propionispira arboris TaxID=84035 RepID=A0A1H6ZN81_9FIRM|nr:hypothetical protein SAMN05660742_10917 [Propionispira arboris]
MTSKWIAYLSVFVSILIVLSSMYYYYNWKHGAYMDIEGTLLLPINYNEKTTNKKAGIYQISTLAEISDKPYFSDERYEKYAYPFIIGGDFICVAKNKETGDNVLLRVENGHISEMMNSNKSIYFPVVSPDLNTIWYLQSEDNDNKTDRITSLWKYNRINGMKEKLFDDRIDFSSGILVAPDESIIFVQQSGKLDGHSEIIQISNIGEKRVLLSKAHFPSWYEKGKSILFKSGNQINVFILKSGETISMGSDDRWWDYPPAVSPDKKHLAVVEYARIQLLGGERDHRLKVISIDGKVEHELTFLQNGGIKPWGINVSWLSN